MDLASILCGVAFVLFMGYLIHKLNKDDGIFSRIQLLHFMNDYMMSCTANQM